jgi:haloacetate dehalogenase
VLWGAKGKIGQWYRPIEVWRDYARGPVTGGAVNSGHYLPEEAPGEVLAALDGFLEGPRHSLACDAGEGEGLSPAAG